MITIIKSAEVKSKKVEVIKEIALTIVIVVLGLILFYLIAVAGYLN